MFGLKQIILLVILSTNQPMLGTISSHFFDEGNSFLYTVTKANHYLEIGDNVVESNGYLFCGQLYQLPIEVNATVDSVESHGIMFKYYIGNNSRIGFSSGNWLDVFGVDFSYTTLFHTLRMANNFQSGFWIDLSYYNIRLYSEPAFTNYLFSPEDLGYDICYFFGRWSYRYPDIECSYNYTTTNDILTFESWVGGEIDAQFGNIITDGADYPTDIKFGNNLHFAIDQETGLTLGFGQRGWVQGKINGLKIKVSMQIDYELQDYDLQDYQFGTFKEFDFPMYVAVIVPMASIVLLISILIAIRIKRRGYL